MLQFNYVVLETTNICNLKCRHCYPTSGPSPDVAYKYGRTKTMIAEQAEKYLCQIPDLKNVKKRLHIGGGESTLFTKEFQAIVSLGKKYGLNVSMVTNCSWAKDQKTADAFIEDLQSRGLGEAQLSLSAFHQEFLSIEYPIRAIRACKKFGVYVILRPIVTKAATVAKTLEKISLEDLQRVNIAVSQCLPVGRAREEISADDFFYDDIPYAGCHDLLNLTIRQDGSVYPCCSGSDITNALRLGNANTESLRDILFRAELDPLLMALFYQGTRYLAEIFHEAQGKNFLQDRHVNICHLCNDLFIDDEVAFAVRRALDNHLKKLENFQSINRPIGSLVYTET